MTNTRQIAFGYSTQCNIKCDHCVAADELSRNVKMDLSKAKAIIEEMAHYNVTGISFTAGEPLLFFNDIRDLVQICKKNGIYSRIVTNGYWAKTKEHSDNIVSELMLSGLSQLRISYSRWHQKNITVKTLPMQLPVVKNTVWIISSLLLLIFPYKMIRSKSFFAITT